MLSVLAAFIVLMVPVAAIVTLSLVVEAWQRAEARVRDRQVRLTDAVHAELGALVSPVVEKRAFRPWRVVFAMPSQRADVVSRLVSITDRVLAAEARTPNHLHIVFTRPHAA